MSISGVVASVLSFIVVVAAILFIMWYLAWGDSEIVREIRELKKTRKAKKASVSIRKSADTTSH